LSFYSIGLGVFQGLFARSIKIRPDNARSVGRHKIEELQFLSTDMKFLLFDTKVVIRVNLQSRGGRG
jgi:hypothetical protein